MKKFMITFNHIDGEWEKLSAAQISEHGSLLEQFVKELEAEKQSKLVFFHPAEAARTVRMHSDRRVEVNEGPYLESNEQAGGYYIIEAESMEEAVEWARKGRFMPGSNEVREILGFQP